MLVGLLYSLCIPVLQLVAVQPGVQEQVLGAVHLPPLLQPPEHTAARE